MAKVLERDVIKKQHESLDSLRKLMCKYLSVKNVLVLELGAGTALPSLLCAAYGHTAIATDLKKVLPLTQKCLDHNPNLEGTAKAMELYWYDYN